MRQLLIFTFVLLSLKSFAQKSDTLVTYNFNGIPTKKVNKATSIYKIFKKDNANWIKITSDQNLIPLKRETFSDSALTILNGTYLNYKNGKIALKGAYFNNERIGIWTNYDSLAKVYSTKNYSANKLNGLSTSYWENGAIQEEGKYIDGEKQGEWKMYYETGETALKEIYNEKNKLIDSAYLNVSGQPIVKDSIFKSPTYPGGIKMFYRYLGKSVRYPSDDVKNNTQGRVVLSFTVSKSGGVEDVTVVAAPSYTLGVEGIRVLESSPKWIPGRLFNKPANIRYEIDVNFSLN
ncbi:energy transducer TonB [Pedobacter fastidiosus]|uniref:Energy transducer TonB n=1 Tax=Pedobacter fastidiosus TaxID=2765361 RepID=A0ABR7KY37_9SPHI|nr:energy transducer TonB [Pedobacter fastidiosus]MBC6113039.1 energy transducer TonB [Pedobacter fastidiosus]